MNRFTFNNLAFTTAADYTQGVGVAIDIAGDLSIQVNGEASLDEDASIQARNLFFSANDLWNEADITFLKLQLTLHTHYEKNNIHPFVFLFNYNNSFSSSSNN